MIEVYVVCDSPFTRAGVQHSVSSLGDFAVVGASGMSDATVAEIAVLAPDVVVLDICGSTAPKAPINRIRRACERTRVVAICNCESVDLAVKALDAGAAGILTVASEVTELRSAIRRAMQGDNYVEPDIAVRIFDHLRQTEKLRKEAEQMRLTLREEQVVGCLMEGMTNRQIAEKLAISEKTVKHYVGTLKGKFCAANRLEIVLHAQRLSL